MFDITPPRPGHAPTPELPALNTLPALRDALVRSPYLTRLCRSRTETLDLLVSEGGARVAEDVISRVSALEITVNDADLLRILRQAKADIHLALACRDLSCEWDWDQVTRTFSRFADVAVHAALRAACARAADRNWVKWENTDEPLPGLFILSLGKLGAFELNYSSDIDLVAFFDPETFPFDALSAGDAARRIIQHMSQILEAQTEHGYVLRVDLRLRPDPRSTPVAVSTRSAELYYEGRGQNWERMAYIKARLTAGDPKAAKAFLEGMEPFVWRRHLDFWALDDIRAIKQQIHTHGGHLDLSNAEFDVKLGQGGIREIEFFAQTQQLIHGGRNPGLRHRRTIDALEALAREAHITSETAQTLSKAYARLRGIEHRIQMLNDEHTHTLSGHDEQRDRVAALCGVADLSTFDKSVGEIRQIVSSTFYDLFDPQEELDGVKGNLVFTGVDEDPDTVRTLAGLGFSNPSQIIADFQTWHRGGIRATRTSRGRQLLSSIERRLFLLMHETGNPDLAYDGLKSFLNGLSAGIQTLSLLVANPAILEDIISIFSIAPRLAADLGNRPELLEALLEGGFLAPLTEDTCGHFEAIRNVPLKFSDDFEEAMNEVRRLFRDAHFRIRFTLLHDPDALDEINMAFTRLADACIGALEPVALKQAEKTLGSAPGTWSICGLGKLGSNALTADSDLDMMVIFEPQEGQSAAPFFARATQRLITALSAQTEEGLLYEADMQLRPSGRAGPVAVRLSSFMEYYAKDAWTWEHMALTRLRPIAGNAALCKRISAEKQSLLSLPRDPETVKADAWDMRQRLLRERPAKHEFDLKLVEGGMIDVEFFAQILQLIHPDEDWGNRQTLDVLKSAAQKDHITTDVSDLFIRHYHNMDGVLAFQRIALSAPTPAEDWPEVLKRRAARALQYDDFTSLCETIRMDRGTVWDVFCNFMQPAATEMASLRR